MPPDLPNNQEITLKKRARRRLVGAVALVLLMIIILPSILQDRAALKTHQEAIKVTMPERVDLKVLTSNEGNTKDKLQKLVDVEQQASTTVPVTEFLENQSYSVSPKTKPSADTVAVTPPVTIVAPVENTHEPVIVDQTKKTVVEASQVNGSDLPGLAANEVKIAENQVVQPQVKTTKANEVKPSELKVKESSRSQSKAANTKTKNDVTFSVQVGVFSDDVKVKQLQSKLKEIGYSSTAEKLSTPKGEKFRLRAGHFSTRQNALAAQASIKKMGLDGMVVSND